MAIEDTAQVTAPMADVAWSLDQVTELMSKPQMIQCSSMYLQVKTEGGRQRGKLLGWRGGEKLQVCRKVWYKLVQRHVILSQVCMAHKHYFTLLALQAN
jgi:hypothetical protein